MLVLVGPENVSSLCINSSCGGKSHDLQVGHSSLQRGLSRVRLTKSFEGKTLRSLEGNGRQKNVCFNFKLTPRKLSIGHMGSRSTAESRECLRSRIQESDDGNMVSTSGSKDPYSKVEVISSKWRAGAFGAVTAVILVFGPAVNVADVVVTLSDNSAIAASTPIGQMRPGTMLLDKLVGGFKSSKVLDKVVTVVSGQVVVNPDELEKDLKEILDGPDSFEKWRNGLLDNVTDGIGTAVDVISHLTPEGVQESLATSVTGFFEAGAERFAAFELSALVGLTERWLIYIPLVVLPMAWQMRARSNARAADAQEREERRLILSEENQAKAERVQRELERIRLKASLMDIIKSMGEVALQRLENGPQVKSREINDIVDLLKDLNPGHEVQLNPKDRGSTMTSGSANDAFSSIPAAPQLDGNWSLVYVSQSGQNGNVPQLPGVEIHNPRQQVWHQGSISTPSPSLDAVSVGSSLLMAKNVAELRLGPLGVVEVAVQGRWESLRNGQAGLVSFDTFLARPKEVLGTRFGDDMPPFRLPLPQALQQSAEWEVLYLDETVRINRGLQGQLFIFTRKK